MHRIDPAPNAETVTANAKAAGPPVREPIFLSWPPPGLARIQGDMYAVARWLGGGALLILPLLWATVARQDPWELGPLGDSLWVAFVLGLVGIPILMAGHSMLVRLLGRARAASRQGYGWRVIALVAADQRRDGGFLLQGARVYSAMTPVLRRRLASVRPLTAMLFMGAAFWLSFGFALAVVLAARGLLGPSAVAWLTLGPSAGLLAAGVVLHAWEEGVLRRARKAWHGKPWTAELARADVLSWLDTLEGLAPGMMTRDDAPRRHARTFRLAGGAAIVAAGIVLVPVFILAFTSTMSPVMARVALPRYTATVERYAELEPLRAYMLEPDASITPQDAGETLTVLSAVGARWQPDPRMKPPVRTYAEGWVPADAPAELVVRAGRDPGWFKELLEQPVGSMNPLEREYLERVAAHPAHAEWSRLARASTVDVLAGRYVRPLPEGTRMAGLPLPRYGSFREGAYAHVGKAALEAERGDVAAAETTLRETISAGILLADHGPTLLDNLIGIVVAGYGASALEGLWRSTGRVAEANELAALRATAVRVARLARVGAGVTPEGAMRAMPDVVLDSAALRGLRWEYITLLNTLGPCLNLRQIVFGPTSVHDQWQAAARDALVRFPSESHYFELAAGGLFGGTSLDEPTLLTRVAGLTMGGGGRQGSCSRVLTDVVSGF